MATWLEDVQKALMALGGVAPLEEIYNSIRGIRPTLPPSFEAIVRRTIETNSSDSDVFGGTDLFYSAHGKGQGVWGLRSMIASTDTEPSPTAAALQADDSFGDETVAAIAPYVPVIGDW